MLRSQFILSGSATLVASPGFAVGSSTVEQAIEAIAAVERKARARIGLTVLRPHGSLVIGHRAQERFPLVSTQKLAVVMTLLARRDLIQIMSFGSRKPISTRLTSATSPNIIRMAEPCALRTFVR